MIAVGSEQQAATTGRPPFDRHGWFAVRMVRRVAFGRSESDRKAERRWRRALPSEYRFEWRISGECCLLVRGDALLPDGRSVAQTLRGPLGAPFPVGVKEGTTRAAKMEVAKRQILAWDMEFRGDHPNVGCTTKRYFRELARLYGPKLEALCRDTGFRLNMGRAAIIALRVRQPGTEALDRRAGRSGRKSKHDPRLARVVEGVVKSGPYTAADAIDAQQREALNWQVEPLPPWKCYQIAGQVWQGARVKAAKGPRAFEAICVPKTRMDYSDVPAGTWLVLDGRVADVMCRTPHGRGGWKAIRPVVLGTMCLRSTLLRAVVRETENSSGILAGLAAWLREFGAPEHVTKDRGEAYKRAAGTRHGTPRQRRQIDDRQLGSVFGMLGVTVHETIPYRAWAKRIESIWRLIKRHVDRWHASFWGGSPAERPERAVELARDVMNLPTVEEFARHVQLGLEVYNSAPRRGLGGLSPNLLFEQTRGVIRRIDPEVIDFICTPIDGPPRVGRDGITHQNIRYTLEAQDLARLQGHEVWIRPNIEHVGVVALCDSEGRPLCVASQEQLVAAGVSDERARAARARAARYRRIVAEYCAAREYSLGTSTGQILREQRAYQQAQEAELRRQMAAPAEAAVTVCRPAAVAAGNDSAGNRSATQRYCRLDRGARLDR